MAVFVEGVDEGLDLGGVSYACLLFWREGVCWGGFYTLFRSIASCRLL